MTREQRLDDRLFDSEPFEMALPTPRLAALAQLFEPTTAIIQCAGVILPLVLFVFDPAKVLSVAALPFALTILYGILYLLRLLPLGNKLDGNHRTWVQFLAGFSEIILLGILDAIYSIQQVSHESYWWALYILPIFRLAHTDGSLRVWAGSLTLSSVFLCGVQILFAPQSEITNWAPIVLAKIALLVLCTFILFYVLRLLDLSQEAARFWFPLTSRFIGGSFKTQEGQDLLAEIFEKGVDGLISADRGALWILDTYGGSSVLQLRYEYSREQHPRSIWHRWVQTRNTHQPGKVYEREKLVAATPFLQQYGRLASDQVLIKHSEQGKHLNGFEWTMNGHPDIRSWMVTPVHAEKGTHLMGFFEVGFRWRLSKPEWIGVEARVVAVSKALGEAFERIRQTNADLLKSKLLELDRKAEDGADIYRIAVEAMCEYFRRPVFIVQYSEVANRIQTVIGDVESSKVQCLEDWLVEEKLDHNRAGAISVCRVMEPLEGEPITVCYLIWHLLPREPMAEMIVLVDHAGQFSNSDHYVLRDSAMVINAAIIRRRVSNLLQPDALTILGPRATQRQLHTLVQRVKETTAADVVILYEFEDDRPKHPPIIVGKLRQPEYVMSKPLVLEEPSPILLAARANEPIFFEDIQSDSIGKGLNRHGDPVFAVREGIRSSIGFPLRTGRGIIGVMWINFRTRQSFDEATHRGYFEYFMQLPRQLESIQLMEIARSQAEQRERERLGANLHDHVLQDLLALGGWLSSIETNLHTQDLSHARESLSSALAVLTDAENSARAMLDELHEIPRISDVAQLLDELFRRLKSEYDLPEELKYDGLDEIPFPLSYQVYPVIQEAIRNAVRHGRAKRVVVQASSADGILRVVVRDNGLGFQPTPHLFGYGIRSMQSRIRWLGGKIEIGSKEGKGTGIVIEVPVRAEEIENVKPH